MSTYRRITDNVIFVIPVAASLLAARLLFDVPSGPGESALLILIYATATFLAAFLLIPVDPDISTRSFLNLFGKCLASVIAFLVATQIDTQAHATLIQLIPISSVLFLLLICALGLMQIFIEQRTNVRQIGFFAIAMFTSIPLWLGSVAEITGNQLVTTNLIVGANPLTALAVSLDFDYLRSNWFYQHSVLGSLRYEYYSWSSYVLILILVTAALAFHATGAKYHRFVYPFRKDESTS
jgi:hypothetical protein